MRIFNRCLTGAVLVPLALGLLPILGCGDGDGLPSLQRVVLIVCDTLSARHLPAYGHEGVETDFFDSLASRGVLFRHCVTPQVWTLTAHMSLFTGLEPGVHRVGAGTALTSDIPLLAETLAGAGFFALGFRTDNGWLDGQFGFGRGFDPYRSLEIDQNLEGAARDWLGRELELPAGHDGTGLVFLHFMDVHTRTTESPCPYTPRGHRRLSRAFGPLPDKKLRSATQADDGRQRTSWDLAAYDTDFLRDSYDLCIEAWDDTRLRACLDEVCAAPELSDALIIVTSDHGEEFLEHGRYLHRSPHAEVREVPLLLIWPGHLPGGVVIEDRVSLVDVAPTILELAGLPLPDPCQGVSLRRLLTGRGRPPARDFLVDGHNRGHELQDSALVGRVDGRWYSLVARTDTTGCVGTYEPESVAEVRALYDLEADPAETRDVREDHPAVVAELSRRLALRLVENALLARSLGTGEGAATVQLPAEDRERLRALGY